MEKVIMKKDINIFNEYCGKMKICIVLFYIIALLGLAGVIVDIVVFDFNFIGFCIANLFFVFAGYSAIELTIQIIKEKKAFINALNRVDVFTFDDEYLTWAQYEGETELSSHKLFYKDILYFRLTKTYALLYYNKKDCAPITKSDELIDFLISKNIKKK